MKERNGCKNTQTKNTSLFRKSKTPSMSSVAKQKGWVKAAVTASFLLLSFHTTRGQSLNSSYYQLLWFHRFYDKTTSIGNASRKDPILYLTCPQTIQIQ